VASIEIDSMADWPLSSQHRGTSLQEEGEREGVKLKQSVRKTGGALPDLMMPCLEGT
jgi:hypothetical protein